MRAAREPAVSLGAQQTATCARCTTLEQEITTLREKLTLIERMTDVRAALDTPLEVMIDAAYRRLLANSEGADVKLLDSAAKWLAQRGGGGGSWGARLPKGPAPGGDGDDGG